jgi:Tfp pilus assembly protein PilF
MEQNPQDPMAHYELALALSGEGQVDAAMDEYRVALDLGGENYDFYMTVGGDLAGRGAWPEAAMAYLRLAQVHPAPLPQEMGDALHESLYEAARSAELFNLISLEDIAAIDPTLGGVVRARYVLYNEGPVRAQAVITVVLEHNAENPDARLVQAEIFIETGAVDRARAMLEELLREENLPEWIRVRAQPLFDQTQP